MYLVTKFNNFKVSVKIWMLAGIAVLGFGAIFITTMITGAIENSARDDAASGSMLEFAQARMEASSLMVRRREKDFFLRLEARYIDSYNADMDETIRWLDEAAGYTEEGAVDSAITQLKSILERHRVQFNKVADMWVRAGLTTDDGLYNDMQDSVHYIEEALGELNDDELMVKMLMMRRHEKDLMLRVHLRDDNGEYTNGARYAGRVYDRQAEFMEILDGGNYSGDVKADLTEKLNAYVDAFREYANIRSQLVVETAVLSDIYAETGDHFEVLKNSAARINADGMAAADNAASVANFILITVILVLGGVSAVVAIFAIKTIVKPVVDLEHALADIAEGDYETEVPGTEAKDEIGSMARVVVTLRDGAKERIALERQAAEAEKARLAAEEEKIRQEQEQERARMESEAAAIAAREKRAQEVEALILSFDESIKAALSNLQMSSTQMRETAGGMVRVADSTGQQAASVSQESDKMQESVATMASAVEEFSASIREANAQVQAATGLSREAVEATEKGSQSIEQLSDASSAIEEVVNMINDIAEQTNLLALNATIESARAGEAGKGFAVVANEVKSLATQTGSATEDIKRKIDEMQSVSGLAVEAIGSISAANVRLNDVMLGISAAIEEQEATTNEISRGVQLASEGTVKVNDEIAQVSINAGETGASSNEVMQAASELENISSLISAEVESFLNDVRDIQSRG
ncbi:methyl-accepting chemotaxis protein [Pseudemcibacter aquimaris]|uniref:methyl-accepting chemotaxis protein n=1 Tax=Pseudemcibacter aquimaris TaxID=2857064 RepID=UPI00201258D3|nr:methyl-accepting chemotaxis protein [Pseudemcibacter aquimaris]MCC3859878.1 methyl-accepting chemotaxis protein [Pseudemcibacter aquimaris]WDU57210.1 HAMP domain-containing protein [Pseudemcibacter aquimaris]